MRCVWLHVLLHGTILTRLTAFRLHLAPQLRECLLSATRKFAIPCLFFLNPIYTFTLHSDKSLVMSAIGSLIFCNDCGNLLDGSAGKKNVTLTCAICGATCKGALSQSDRIDKC